MFYVMIAIYATVCFCFSAVLLVHESINQFELVHESINQYYFKFLDKQDRFENNEKWGLRRKSPSSFGTLQIGAPNDNRQFGLN